jgi:DNA-binding NarL/FixJ family response regulator
VDAEASGLIDGLACLRERSARVVVTELELPDADGLDAVQRFCSTGAAVLVLSRRDQKTWAPMAHRAGASGYVSKTAEAHEIVAAVRSAAAGHRCFSQDALDSLLAPSQPRLSRREVQVLRALAEGARPHDIADMLNISPGTASTYRRRAAAKLGVSTEAELTRAALAMGLVE